MDWILASAPFGTIAVRIDHTHCPGSYPSDHFPVTATLRAPRRQVEPADATQEVARTWNRWHFHGNCGGAPGDFRNY